MQTKHVSGNRYFLVFDKGDEIVDSIRRFATEKQIRGGRFAGIGAVERATIAWWSWETKEYENRELDEQCEIASLIGDIAILDGQPKIHAHVVLGRRRNNEAVAGHLVRGVVRPTLEIDLVVYDADLVRKNDAETRLPLLSI